MKYRLGFDRLTWAPFPIYVQATKKGTRTTYLPWPIIRSISGETNGFAVWPLFGTSRGPGVARSTAASLAPHLGQHARAKPDAPEGDATRQGIRIPALLHPRRSPGQEERKFHLALFRLHPPDGSLSLQRAALPLALRFVEDGATVLRQPVGSILHPLRRQGGGLDVGDVAPLAPQDLGRRRHRPVEDELLLLPVLVARRGERIAPEGAARVQDPRLAPPQHLGQRRRQPRGPDSRAPSRCSSPTIPTCARPGRRSSRSTATTTVRPARRGPRSSGPRSAGVGTPPARFRSSTWDRWSA